MKTLLLLVAASLIAGCNPFGPGSDYVIKVDSVSGAGAVSGGIPFTVKVYGYVGPTGCSRFKEFRVNRSAAAADVTVIGHVDDHKVCTQALVFLDGEPLTVQPPIVGPFNLRFHQPDNTILTKTVYGE